MESEFRDWLVEHWADVEPVIMSRSTQTNEAARCAVLLPILDRLAGPLALIEAGAAAGLVLYPDRYSYLYTVNGTESVRIDPSDGPGSLELSRLLNHCDARRVVPPVLETA